MTEFERKVYDTVKKIPKGEVLTYKEVARLIGKPLAYRAVGNALNKNPFKQVPCHRVIRTDGMVGGYVRGLKVKAELLKKEGFEVELLGIR
ncbi:MAG: MGMT family protein [Patescibacteria group bacterium]